MLEFLDYEGCFARSLLDDSSVLNYHLVKDSAQMVTSSGIRTPMAADSALRTQMVKCFARGSLTAPVKHSTLRNQLVDDSVQKMKVADNSALRPKILA